MCVNVYVHMCVHVYVYKCVCARVYVHICVYVCTWMNIHASVVLSIRVGAKEYTDQHLCGAAAVFFAATSRSFIRRPCSLRAHAYIDGHNRVYIIPYCAWAV
jgi:hypothetical protein